MQGKSQGSSGTVFHHRHVGYNAANDKHVKQAGDSLFTYSFRAAGSRRLWRRRRGNDTRAGACTGINAGVARP